MGPLAGDLLTTTTSSPSRGGVESYQQSVQPFRVQLTNTPCNFKGCHILFTADGKHAVVSLQPTVIHRSTSTSCATRATMSVALDAPISQPSGDKTLQAFVPEHPLCRSAFKLAKTELPQAILNHSLRVFIYAKWLAEREESSWASLDNIPLLFAACICHDFGATHHHNGEQRFEVEGADAAVAHLRGQDVSEDDAHQVWMAIALHTSPGIAERINPLSRLVRLGVLIDFRQATRDQMGANEYVASIEHSVPRMNIEKVLGDAVVAQAVQNRDKAPAASWAGVLLRSHLENPGWQGVNRAF